MHGPTPPGVPGPAAAAVFVKTPGHSPLKTRLAADVGTAAAERLHRACAAAVAAVLRQCAPRLAGYFAVAESTAHACWPGLPVLAQGPGSLGARLDRVSACLHARYRSVLLLGADAPQLDAALLDQALHWLGQHGPRMVMGPAADGGFWLFGSNRPLPPGLWERVPYSRADTAARLRDAVQALAALRLLPVLHDLDTAADMAPVRDALAALPQPLPEQRAVAALLDRLAATTDLHHG